MSAVTRVLWLTKGLGLGGTERLIVTSIPYLDQSRFDIEVVYLLPWKDAFVADLTAAGVSVRCLGRRRGTRFLWPFRLRRLVRGQRFDIVHTHSPLSAAVARVVLGRSACFVHTEHNVWPRYRFASRWMNAVTFGRNSAVVAVSQSVADSIRQARDRNVPRVEVIYHGVDLDAINMLVPDRGGARQALGLDGADRVVGTVGNFTPKKNQHVLLRAFATLHSRLPDARLVLIGSGPLEDELREGARTLAIDHRVVFAGSRADVMELLPAFDVFCLTSQFEGLSIALIEAMASGIACIATRVGGLPEVFGDGPAGILVEPSDPAALAHALELLLADEWLRKEYAEEGRRRARSFDIKRAVRQLETIYDEVMALC